MRIIRQKGKTQAEKQYKNYVYCFTIDHIDFVFDMRVTFIDTYTTTFNLSIIYVGDRMSITHSFIQVFRILLIAGVSRLLDAMRLKQGDTHAILRFLFFSVVI